MAALIALAACSGGFEGGRDAYSPSRAQQVTMDVGAIEAGMLGAHRHD